MIKKTPAGIPTLATLNKYGLTREMFMDITARQHGVCPICEKHPNGHWCIDHEHVKGWKKLLWKERSQYVRGVVCWFCNHYYLGKAITVTKAQNVVNYLQVYQTKGQ